MPERERDLQDTEYIQGMLNIAPSSRSSVSLRHEPLREIVQPLLLVLVALAVELVPGAAAPEPLLAGVERRFDAPACEEAAVHFLMRETGEGQPRSHEITSED